MEYFTKFRVFPISTSVDVTVQYVRQYGQNVGYFLIFRVYTLSCVNTT